MKALADLLPAVMWAFSIAAQLQLYLEHLTLKGKVMPEVFETAGQDPALTQDGAAAAAAAAAAAQTAQSGAGQTSAAPAAAPAPIAVHPVVQAVVSGVQATQPPSNWATTAASVLQGLMPIVQPAEQIGRASTRTQGEIAIGVAALSVLLQAFFPHPNA